VTLSEDERFSFLGARHGCVYGLLVPGQTPFRLTSEGLERGPPTGELAGGRAAWRTDGGEILGAMDGGEIFSWRPGAALNRTGTFIPSLRGRRFLARWTAACKFGNNVVGGTSDGYLFEYQTGTGSLRNLGKPDLSLGIRDLATEGDRIIGIAGRPNDLCTVFEYSQRTGFVDHGTDVAGSMELSGLVCLQNGRVAVGEDARIAHVNIYDLGRTGPSGRPKADLT